MEESDGRSDEKFLLAIDVARELPQTGSLSASVEEKLMLYSLYKQATQGLCIVAPPPIWNVVERRKWSAWNSLGNMDRGVAKIKYIENLHEIMKSAEGKAFFQSINEQSSSGRFQTLLRNWALIEQYFTDKHSSLRGTGGSDIVNSDKFISPNEIAVLSCAKSSRSGSTCSLSVSSTEYFDAESTCDVRVLCRPGTLNGPEIASEMVPAVNAQTQILSSNIITKYMALNLLEFISECPKCYGRFIKENLNALMRTMSAINSAGMIRNLNPFQHLFRIFLLFFAVPFLWRILLNYLR